MRERLTRACEHAGRDPAEVTLLPVTKFFPASDVEILYGLGCRAFGESREQEASAKVAALQHLPEIEWHMIGRLQRNKARAVARWAYAVHSVDNARLVDALDRGADRRDQPLRVFVQVSLDSDDNDNPRPRRRPGRRAGRARRPGRRRAITCASRV